MIRQFLAMGGYASYVWPAWGLTVLTMASLTVSSWRSFRARQAELKVLQEQAPP